MHQHFIILSVLWGLASKSELLDRSPEPQPCAKIHVHVVQTWSQNADLGRHPFDALGPSLLDFRVFFGVSQHGRNEFKGHIRNRALCS